LKRPKINEKEAGVGPLKKEFTPPGNMFLWVMYFLSFVVQWCHV